MTPKDHTKPQEVRDYAAEKGIKWTAIVQGLILASIIGVFTFVAQYGTQFSGKVLDKFDEVNTTLTQIRDLIAIVNTKAEINSTKHNINDKKNDQQDAAINQNTQAIYQMRFSDEN